MPNTARKSPFNPLPSAYLVILIAAFIAYTGNFSLWKLATGIQVPTLLLWQLNLSIFLIVTLVISLFLWLLPHTSLIKPVAMLCFLLAALIGYFQTNFGIIFHPDMIDNIAANITEHNYNEASELVSVSLIHYLSVYWLIPSFMLLLIPLSKLSLRREIRQRIQVILIITSITGIVFYSNHDEIKSFAKEHRNLRAYVNPLYPLGSLSGYIKNRLAENHSDFNVIGLDALQKKNTSSRTIGIMVVGETARADHFSIDGYAKQTNPLLEKQHLINFPDTQSCGTSTIYSVPCMFSFLDGSAYSPEKAASQSNVLDVLQQAGVKVIWIDNNSNCKGVCKRVETINYREYPDPSLPFYGHGEYFDEILLHRLQEKIAATDKDMLIVLHMLGSHGPAYFKRSPDEFKHFTPECKANSYQSCKSSAEFINEYDNSIVYTDFFLDKTIKLLQNLQQPVESFMLYASDHGESLGDNGLYLHGAPLEKAPEEQMHIPFLAWLSENYIKNHQLDIAKIHAGSKEPHTHDDIAHSLLGLMSIKTGLYRQNNDIFRVSPEN